MGAAVTVTVSGVRPLPEGDTVSQTIPLLDPFALTEIPTEVEEVIDNCVAEETVLPAVALREIDVGVNCRLPY